MYQGCVPTYELDLRRYAELMDYMPDFAVEQHPIAEWREKQLQLDELVMKYISAVPGAPEFDLGRDAQWAMDGMPAPIECLSPADRA